MAGEQAALNQAYDATHACLNVQVVAQVSAAAAVGAPTVNEVDGIWAQVFDAATGTIRVVEVV